MNILEPLEKKNLTYKTSLNDQETQAKIFLLSSLHPKYQLEEATELKIDYQNSLMEPYRTTIVTGKGGIRVKKIDKIS